jgi:hypothetical protein
MAPLLDLGVGKSATAHIIQSAAAAYKDRGYKYEIPCQILIVKKLTIADSIMVTSERLMEQLHSLSTGKRTENCTLSSPKESLKGLGNRHLSKV